MDNEAELPTIDIKFIFRRLSICYGGLLGFVTVLDFFGIGSPVWKSLGWWGYIALILLSSIVFLMWTSISIYNHYRKFKKKAYLLQNQTDIKLIRNCEELIQTNIDIVSEANEILLMTGSRSRDKTYFKAIESKLASNRRLIYNRVLWGKPFHTSFKNHLLQVLSLRDPNSREFGYKTVYIGIFENAIKEPERFVCANEKRALVVLPSFTGGLGCYDTAIIFSNSQDVECIIRYVKELYAGSRSIESEEEIKSLITLVD
ncbi:MAG: hypothetical protein NT166_00135 [Candidatus Aminicenantes bacterium]|nr:hypothetical protein [Candidatus Aminicenantes bacterium]